MIGANAITGTLKQVSGYEQFSNIEGEQSGHYLALSFSADEGAAIKTKLIGGKKGEVDCTADKFCVYLISDKDTQSISVTVEKDQKTKEKKYSLKGLTLA